jgi:hypothetical protein
MARTSNPGGRDTDFVALVVEAYHRAGIRAERLSATGVRVPLPGAEPLETDYGEAAERARAHPVEQYPRMADEVVRATTRMFRERGLPLGTHYPPRSDDHGRGALIAVFEHMGVDARFESPQVLSLPVPGEGRATTDVSAYLAEVENASVDEAFDEAGRFARAVSRQIERSREQESAPAERLRVRLYPDSAFPEGVIDKLVARELAPGLWQAVAVDRPDSVQPLSRHAHERSGRSTEEAFAEAVAHTLEEPVETSEHEIDGVRIVHVGGRHPYVSARVHVLGRHLGEAPHGALVAFPVPQALLAHPLGQGHPVTAMGRLRELAERFVADADKPVSSRLYWWRPGSGAEADVPRLSAVAAEVDHETRSVSLYTDDQEFGPLFNALM